MSDAEIAEFFKPKAYTNGEVVEYSTSVVLGWNLATQEQVAEFELRRAVTSAEERIKAERSKADQAIAPLQDAVDLDEATEAEALRLKEWKRYRVALNRLPDQPGYPAEIDWPAPPA
ncbi:tail fiber assembly protein [Pseudomonas sp. BJa3]|nr:tail fiber assembly protein [Pseudomonas sp. BJa3]